MDAIIVFCHFCEQHGPSVVMCTQPYRQSRSQANGIIADSQPEKSSISRASSHIGLFNVGNTECVTGAEVPSASFLLNADGSSVPLAPKNSPGTSQQLGITSSTCRACSFTTRDESGLVSHDHAANTAYISTQWPKDQELFEFVRNACQRSLSCEVCPGTEGAFYFGDEANGHVVSYNFHLKDSQARGFQSRYSFLVLSWDRVLLLSLWPLIVPNLAKMACRLRSAAARVYDQEISEPEPTAAMVVGPGSASSVGRQVQSSFLVRGVTPPAPIPPAFTGQALAAGTAMTGPIRQRRQMDADMRSLGDLTKDEQIFYRLHAWFTWLLRASARRWSLLPSLTAPPDDDSLVEQEERQALMTVGGEQPGPSVTAMGATSTTSGNPPSLVPPFSGSTTSQNPIPIPPTGIIGTAQMAVGKSLGLTDGSGAEETTIALLVLARLLHGLGIEAFRFLAQHVVVGNQLVVLPLRERLLGCLVISGVAKLLPKGCLKQIVNNPEYLPPFRCNLLSLTPDARPPEASLEPGEGVLFLSVSGDDPPSQPLLHFDADIAEPFINSLHFKLSNNFPLPDSTAPTDPACSTDTLTMPSSNPTILTPVSGLVTRVVQLLSMQPPLPPSSLDLALSAARQEWINKSRLLYSFKRCQGPTLTDEETTRRWAGVLAAIDCNTPENSNVACFWQGALSQYSRQNPCHIHRRRTGSTTSSRRGSVGSSNVDLTTVLSATTLVD
ncbi:unnamed protein product [Calicophoron daubneyi]|uniref:Folliculin n=1 Tax=Calicophoron daubneyi TaxID=300641 RepID=A0AAV2TZE2_CALDB